MFIFLNRGLYSLHINSINKCCFLTFFSISLFFHSHSQKLKDSIYFKNGTMIIGKLKKIKMGVVTFDPDDANDVTVQLRKIKSITGNSEIFRVETIRHGVFFGFLKPDTVDNKIIVLFGRQQTPLDIEDIFNLYRFSDKFAQRFSGNVGAGYSYSRSSGFGRINFDGTLNYATKNQELTLTATGLYSQTDSGFSREMEEVNIKDNIYFNQRSFATVLGAYQRNLELGLERRIQTGFGIGNKFITSKSVYAWGRGGIAFNKEKSVEGQYSGLLTEAFAQLQFNFFRFEKPEINIDFSQTVYISLTEAGRIRNDGEMNVSWEIINDFKLNLNIYHNYDNKPPGEGGSNYDFGTVIGFQYKF